MVNTPPNTSISNVEISRSVLAPIRNSNAGCFKAYLDYCEKNNLSVSKSLKTYRDESK